jgi:signal transduction histidine kinase
LISPQTNGVQLIYEVIRRSSSGSTLNETISFALTQLLSNSKAQSAAISLLDEKKRIAKLHWQQELPVELEKHWQEISLEPALSEQAITIDKIGWNFFAEATFLQEACRQANLASVLFYPMRAKGKMIGLLSLFWGNASELSPEQNQLVNAVADELAILVESAFLWKQVEETAIIEERQRIARELHDSVTQSLYSLSLYAKGWRRMADNASLDEIKNWLDQLSGIASQTLKEMRLLLYELRPSLLERDGLVGALQRRLDSVENKVSIKTELHVDGVSKLPAKVEQELYRIAQEALNNALKYSDASVVSVNLRGSTGLVELEVVDNGIGFEFQARKNEGMGLPSMEERARKLDSTLEVISNPGEGTRVRVRVAL